MGNRLTAERLSELKRKYTQFQYLHWMDVQELVTELEAIKSELDEKDAAIKHKDSYIKTLEYSKSELQKSNDKTDSLRRDLAFDIFLLRKALKEVEDALTDNSTHSVQKANKIIYEALKRTKASEATESA